MARVCYFTGKRTTMGNQKTHRGKAKYLGGVGKKITGMSKRRFKPNLQRIKVVEDGATVRRRVCCQCIRSGKVQRPVKVKPFATVTV